MADYYSHFSIVIPLSKKQCNWSETLYKAINHLDEGSDISGYPDDIVTKAKEIVHEEYIGGFLLENEGNGLWLQDDLNFMDDDLIAFIQAILIKFDLDTCVAVEVSANCSKPRLDAYGGYALFITKDNAESFSTMQWVNDKKKEHAKKIEQKRKRILFRDYRVFKFALANPDAEQFECECGSKRFESWNIGCDAIKYNGSIDIYGRFYEEEWVKTYDGDNSFDDIPEPKDGDDADELTCCDCGKIYLESRLEWMRCHTNK